MKGLDEVSALSYEQLSQDNEVVQRFDAAMCDDFNVPEALAVLFDLVRDMNTARANGDDLTLREQSGLLKSLGSVLGILQSPAGAFLQSGGGDSLAENEIEALIAERQAAKKNRDFARADEIRDSLKAQGVVLEDSREGTTWRRE